MWGRPSAEPPSVPQDRGALLLEEPPETIARRGRSYRKAAGIIAALGAGLLALGLAIAYGTQWSRSWNLFLMMGILLGPVLLALAAIVFRSSSRLKPIRFYENGLEGHPIVGDRVQFVSYGEVLSIEETRAPLEGDVYRLRTSVPMVMVHIPRDMPGAATVLEHIRARMGRAEFVVRPPAAPSPATQRIWALFPVLGLVIAAVASAFVVFTNAGAFGPADQVLLFGLVFSPFGMIAVTYASVRPSMLKGASGPPPSVKLPAVLVAGLLIYGVVSLALASAASGAPPPVPEIGLRPSVSALAPGLYENETFTLSGVLRVDPGETLVLRNTSVTLDPLAGTPGGVWVASGGQLTFENVTLRGAGSPITFEILGSAQILGSDIADLAGEPSRDHTDGGLEIYSSDVLIDGTTIHDTATNGIFVVGASPVIRNSSVVDAGDDCIELQRSSARIENNTITGCGWAMIVWQDSAPLILGNRFVDNAHGVHVNDSGGRIENNTFDGNGGYAIRLIEGSDPSMAGNAFLTAADDVERGSSFDLTLLCGPAIVGIGLACLGLLYWRHRRDRSAGPPALPGT